MNLSLNHFADQFIFWNLEKISYGYLELIDSKNKKYFFGKETSTLRAKVKINNPNFSLGLLRKGSSGLGESYINNEFETNDLTSLIEISARNINVTYKFSGLLKVPFVQNILNKIIYTNTRKRSKENISAHYDLGNEFFSVWLDKTLTYSCGIFNSTDESLEKAQINKYNKLINLIKPKPGNKILEIGCGWGGLAEQLGKNYDIKLDCITISKKQFEFTKTKINRLGLNHKVKVKMLDYRDVKKEYDNIISIEMIEAVGENYLDKYFGTIKNSLKENGTAAIQGITIKNNLFDRYRNNEDFIQKYIFPGGFLPSVNFMKYLVKKNKLNLLKINSYPDDYAKTLAIWRENFFKTWKNIAPLGFDETFKRMWEFYLSYCEAGFKARNINLIQCSMSNK